MDLRPSEPSRGSLFSYGSHSHGDDYFWRDHQIPIDLTLSIIVPKKDTLEEWSSSDDLSGKENSNKCDEFAGNYLSGKKKKEMDHVREKLKNNTALKKFSRDCQKIAEDNKIAGRDLKLDKGAINLRSSSADQGPKILISQHAKKVNTIQGCNIQENKDLANNNKSKPDRKVFQAQAKELLKNYDKSQLHYKKDGTLDRRYNTTKEYLRLLEIVGEKEEVRSVPIQTDLVYKHIPPNGQRNLIEQARSELERFDKSTLVYTKKNELDKRYNVNKRYIALLEQAQLYH